MDYSFHPLADKEVDEIVGFYDGVDESLGNEFFSELQNSISRVLRFPNAWEQVWPSARRSLLNRFPYALVYQIRSDGILVVAVMHLHREPGYWVARL